MADRGRNIVTNAGLGNGTDVYCTGIGWETENSMCGTDGRACKLWCAFADDVHVLTG